MTEGTSRSPQLDNSIFIQTGGQDLTGNLLLSVPTSKIADIGEYSVSDLTTLFLRMMTISGYMKKNSKGVHSNSGATPPVAFLADLRQAPTQVLYPLVEVLEAVEHNQRGAIAAVYFLKPRSTSKSHILKKLLGLKPSKKRPRVPLFKIVLMKTIQELYTQVDMRYLTLDFSGTLKYSHHGWMFLYENVVQCIEEGKDLVSRLPSIRDRVDLLQEYEPDGQSSTQLQQFLTELTEKYHHIISESSLPTCLTRCKQTLFSIENVQPGNLLNLLHPNLLSGFCSCLHAVFSDLDQWNKTLEDSWRVTESHFTLIIQYSRHKERANEIERKICENYYPLLKDHPIVGRTLSQAELYRAHFTTTLYEPATELLSQATEILEAMQKVKTNANSLPNTGVSSSLVEAIKNIDISSISKRLTTSIQPFTVHMQQLQELYISIHVFHLLFEKALSWYKKVLKFLPESLLHSQTYDSDISQSDPSLYDASYQGGQGHIIYMPPEWLGAVRVFLDRHPPPREEHINRLDVYTPNVVDKKLRAQARSLALRLRLLQRVLSSTRLPLKLVTAVTAWKFELFGGSHADRSSAHHSHMKEVSRNSNYKSRSEEDESTAQENKWPTPNKSEEERNDSSGTTSQDRRTVNFEQGSAPPLRSSVDKKSREELYSKTGQITNKKAAIANKIQMRKNSKSLLRAKSVEFSFNSSSTDGSIFDYEKAVSRAREVKGRERQEEEFHKVRKGENMQRMSEDPKYGQHISLDSRQGKEIDHHHHHHGSVPEINPNDSQNRGNTYYDEQGDDFEMVDYKGHPREPTNQTNKENYERKPESDTPSSGERYIGLSYKAWPIQHQYKGRAKYHSMHDLLQADQSEAAEEEFESGIDTMDHSHLDPYDLVVRRIKDISASDMPNYEKLKCVSSLIANSTLAGKESSQWQEQSPASKLSYSAIDLRERNLPESTQPKTVGPSGPYNAPHFSENPVEAVVRMKRNLAKSMEELSTYHLSMMSDEGGKTFSKLEAPSSPVGAQRQGNSELHFQPTYTSTMLPKRNYERGQMPTVVETKWNDNYSHGQGEPHDNKANPSANADAKPGYEQQVRKELSLSRRFRLDQHGMLGQSEKGQQPHSQTTGLSYPNDSNLQQNRKSHLSRPTNLGSIAGRTFISPSFLRPASSMRNISTQGRENLTFDLMKSIDKEEEKTAGTERNISKDLGKEGQDNFSTDNLQGNDQKATSHTSFAGVSTEDGRPLLNSFNMPNRRFLSFDHTNSGYANLPVYSKRPWSLSLDASVYPVLDQEINQDSLKPPALDIDRLNSEAEMACIDQEEVANSLQKTQKILEEEENRRVCSLDERNLGSNSNDHNSPVRRLVQSESIDNGYGSWASKMVSAPSTSSEGVDMDNVRNEDWMKTLDNSLEVVRRMPGRDSFANSSLDQSSLDKTQEETF